MYSGDLGSCVKLCVGKKRLKQAHSVMMPSLKSLRTGRPSLPRHAKERDYKLKHADEGELGNLDVVFLP